jgi:hypothetical protein
MPFFLDGNPSQGEISEAINYLLGNSQLTTSTNIVNGQVTDAVGSVVSYLYRYLYVKYADSFDGTVNFSNTPTNRQYYGLRNNDSGTESTNPADYIWYQVSGGFSTNKFVFYSVTGGRRINIVVGLSAPSILYQADSGSAIDLDLISGSDGASSRICYAKSTSFALASTPATYQTSGPSGFPPYNTWGGAETWQATPPTLSVNEALFQSDGIYNPATNLTTWNVPYLSNLRVGALSAITANMGTLTAGEITVGSSPVISGTTMTGTGSHLYPDGRFISGNSSSNIVFDGTNFYINGVSTVSVVSSSSSSFVGTEATVATFSVSKNAKTIISWASPILLAASTAGVGAEINARVFIRDSGGTVVSNTEQTCLVIGTMPKIGAAPTVNQFSTNYFYMCILNLSIGTYSLRISDVGSNSYSVLGAPLGLVNLSTFTGGANVYVCQLNT